MKPNDLVRGYVIFDHETEDLVCSHPALQPIKDWMLAANPDYRKHEAVFLEIGKESGHLFFVVLWSTHRGQGQGGVRLRGYNTLSGREKESVVHFGGWDA